MMSVNISDIQEMGVRDSKEQMILVVVYMQVRQVTLPCNLIQLLL